MGDFGRMDRPDSAGGAASVIGWLKHLVNCQTGEPTSGASILKNQFIGIYFSASWCPPCREFTTIMKDSYKQIRSKYGDSSFEIVLAPLDTNETDWVEYRKGMPWYSLNLAKREQIVRLFLHF